MGRLLGDPEVWDDSPARPRPAARGLAGLAIGAVAGLLLAFAVVPRPDPPPPEVRLPRLGPDDFAAAGLVGAGRRLLACPDPAGQPVDLTPDEVGDTVA